MTHVTRPGRIAFLSPSKLTLLIQRSPYDFDEANIDAIHQRRLDRLPNSAVFVLLSGIVVACLTVAAVERSNDPLGV